MVGVGSVWSLVVYGMRTLLAQAVALDDETRQLQAGLDGIT